MLKTAPGFVHLFVGRESEWLLPCYGTLHKIDQPTSLLLAQCSLESQLCELEVETGAERLPWFAVAWRRGLRGPFPLIVPEVMDSVSTPTMRVVLNLDIVHLIFMSCSLCSKVCIGGIG
jgi:hypothetical protein